MVVASPLVYTIVVTNQHELVTATGVTVVDTLPPGVVLVSATASQGTCSGTSTVTCSLGSLENNASATITITVTPSAVGSITNSASVEGNEFDPEPSNNSSSEATEVSGFVIFLPLIQR
ncbi:MAG: hypothetical protein KatS3mg057_0159 [Herpetosiphonaceae bacterium]|nr:MAG: hypothetical protein KatS3mg057_0159 [Herpetosiphonaceae bacterium]